MRMGVRSRGGWVSMPLAAWLIVAPFAGFVWLMWVVIKYGALGLVALARLAVAAVQAQRSRGRGV